MNTLKTLAEKKLLEGVTLYKIECNADSRCFMHGAITSFEDLRSSSHSVRSLTEEEAILFELGRENLDVEYLSEDEIVWTERGIQ